MSTQNISPKRDWFFWLLIVVIVFMMVAGQASVWINQPEGQRLVKMVELAATMLAAAGVMLATYISYRQAKDALSRTAAERTRDKLEETFRLIEKWDDPHFLEARKLSVALGREFKNMSPNNIVQKVDDDPQLRSSVSLMLNYFDFIRLSIKHDRLDLEVIKSQLGPVAIITLDRFDAWIKTQKQLYQTDIAEFRRYLS
ncbi:DUF4760 domain-containing protein [Pseudomonas fulva]|uniref:DUF4760 domain-containing protein n=1 Tax=Pseudomonas fulva TaxID=47880 RepID=UPI002DBB3699|nr:hypothetical protein [Pseudomonas fulva]MEB8056100.1 hypothetical protein [Pseudomonas fulva]